MVTTGRDQVTAFRLESHHLGARLPPGSLLTAAGACGMQNTPPGSAALALQARVTGLTPTDIDRAIGVEKSLLLMWSLRGAPYLFPTGDAAVFTLGLLPDDEDSLRFFILGSTPALELVGMSVNEAVERTAAALHHTLDGRALALQPLGVELASRIAQDLPPSQLAAWLSASLYAENQSLGEAIVHFALHVIALQGAFCFAPRRGHEAPFIRTDQWLGVPLPEANREQARAELVRRYLHCYGPSTAEHFAAWAGIAPAQAAHTWELVASEMVEVNFDRRKTWLLRQDSSQFMSPPVPAGVRFLPPHDPYLLLRDRATLVSDKALQRVIWRSSGNPGVVLADGRCVGTWRPRKKDKRLRVVVELFTPVTPETHAQIRAEAVSLAPYKNCTSVEVEFA